MHSCYELEKKKEHSPVCALDFFNFWNKLIELAELFGCKQDRLSFPSPSISEEFIIQEDNFLNTLTSDCCDQNQPHQNLQTIGYEII